MRRITAGFAVLPLVFAAQLASAETEHVTRTFQVGADAALQLKTFSGHVRISGSDAQQITVDAVRHGTREQLDAIKLTMDQQGSTVIIEANTRERSWFTWWGHSDVVDTDFTIAVPRRARVNVHGFSSDIEVTGVAGDAVVHTFSAPVRLTNVTGDVDVHSFSGPISVRAAEPIGSMVLDTFSGGIDVRVPEKAHAVADFRSFSGRLTSPLPLLLKSTSRRNTTAELDGPGPACHIRVKTFSGNLSIDR